MTHIQIHRSTVGGATPNTDTMFEGEIAVNLTDKKLFVKGATGELITLATPQTHGDTDHVTSVNGLTGSVTLKPSGFEFEIISTTLSVVDDTIPSNGGIRLVRDYLGSTQITFNRFDKQGNDLAFAQINLQNNGGTIVGISEDGQKFFHIISPDKQTRTGHSLTIQSNTVTPGKLKFQDTSKIPNDGNPDDGLIAMETFSIGDKVFVHFIPNVAPPTTVGGVSGEILLDKAFSFEGASGNTLGISLDNLSVVSSFNGATGSLQGVSTFNGSTGTVQGVSTFNGVTGTVDTTSLVLPVTGISGAAGITFSDGTFQESAARNGFRYEASSFITGVGKIAIFIDQSSTEFDQIQVATTDADGNNLQTLYQELMNNGGFISVTKGDSSYILATTVRSDPTFDGTVSTAEEEEGVVISGGGFTYYQLQTVFDYDLDGDLNSGDVYVQIIPNNNVGVSTFNGSTGAIDTTSSVLEVAGLSAGVSGITCASGITLSGNIDTTGLIRQRGNAATTHIDFSSAQDVKIKSADDIILDPADSLTISLGNDSADGIKFTGSQTLNFFTAGAKFLTVTDDIGNIVLGDINELTSNSKITISDTNITMTESGGSVVETFDQNYRRHVDVATFTIDATSAIVTGAKTKSLYRVPYNGTLKNFDVKTSATGGFTACVKIAGSDFATPITGSVTGCSLGVAGFTGSSTAFNQATVTGGQFLYLDVFSNVSGSSAAQVFLTFESR